MINLGNCYFCVKPVMAAEGQSIAYFTRTHKRTGEKREYPTHKVCRKQ